MQEVSVLIKGMEMPTSCVDCLFHKSIYCTLTDICTNTAQGCPLVPVPPHGDLIDRREAIIDANERAYDFWLSDDEVNASIQFLKEQPTIVPADPAKEGE